MTTEHFKDELIEKAVAWYNMTKTDKDEEAINRLWDLHGAISRWLAVSGKL